ncbi:MAG: hypothetical protein KIT22_09475 [Verrucomicrobiae bacterium]|nr:hypothetical protein [Verrucomicrobiae bacterium]
MTRNPEEIPLLFPDPVIEAYLKDVDRTLVRAMVQKTTTQRLQALVAMNELVVEVRRAREREARR